jgi:hypothetical protein
VILPGCPNCPQVHCVTLRELARIETRGRWFNRPERLARIVSGYLMQCPSCMCQFTVTEDGAKRITPEAPPAPHDGEKTREPERREKPPNWLSKPSI